MPQPGQLGLDPRGAASLPDQQGPIGGIEGRRLMRLDTGQAADDRGDVVGPGGLVVGEDRGAAMGGRGTPPCARFPAGPQPRVDDHPAAGGADQGAEGRDGEQDQGQFHTLSPWGVVLPL